MKLWILKPLSEWRNDNPWDCEYEKVHGFVIEAPTEQEARALADGKAGEENDECDRYLNPWLNSDITSCEELTPTGTSRVVMINFHHA